jgi:multicomponent K+:H+ antiporter subunit D
VLLVSSLVVIVGFARAGSLIFWRALQEPASLEAAEKGTVSLPAIAAVAALLAAPALLTVFAGPVTQELNKTAIQLLDRAAYVRAVLGADVKMDFAAPVTGRQP